MLFPTPAPTQTPPPTPVATAQEKCSIFAGASLAGAALKEATLVPAAAGAAEYCKVTGILHGTLNFEVHLPTVWNNKLLYAGGGGWDGGINITPVSPSGATAGYVLVASDGGRQGDALDASAFLNNPTAQADFGYLSIHSVNEVTKEIVRKRYGSDAAFSYFEGCSNGGREALIQATRFPNDFDGIVVRAPACFFTELFQAFVANGKALAAPGGATQRCEGLAYREDHHRPVRRSGWYCRWHREQPGRLHVQPGGVALHGRRRRHMPDRSSRSRPPTRSTPSSSVRTGQPSTPAGDLAAKTRAGPCG